VEVPETRFAKVGEDRIAYQVIGDGPIDLLYVPPMTTVLDTRWEWPPYVSFLRRLSSFSRVIMFDKRGLGASDAISAPRLPPWEEWADDARAVLDAAGSERTAIYGEADAGPTAILFAATEPERTRALVLFNSSARLTADRGVYPHLFRHSYATEMLHGGMNPLVLMKILGHETLDMITSVYQQLTVSDSHAAAMAMRGLNIRWGSAWGQLTCATSATTPTDDSECRSGNVPPHKVRRERVRGEPGRATATRTLGEGRHPATGDTQRP